MGSEEAVTVVKREICEIGRRMDEKGLIAATDGNLSVRTGENEIWTTPTGQNIGSLTPDMLIKVNANGKVLAGGGKPSSELKMHLHVYQARADVGAIVHAHPPYATAHAVAGRPLNRAYMPESVVFLGTVPVAKYATPSTEEVPASIAPYVHDHRGLLLENHGALTWESDLWGAYYLMEKLEFNAKISFLLRQMECERELSRERVNQLLALREKMGIAGATPKGASAAPGVDVCRVFD